jgi:YVTN family beta-propeller protein
MPNTILMLALGLAAQAPESLLVVTNKDENTLSVVSLATGATLAKLPTGVGPHEVAASGNGRWAVATDYGAREPGGTLTVVDLRTLSVAKTIALDPHRRPHGIAFLPDDRTVAVTSETSQRVLLVDVVEGRIVSEHATGQEVSHMVALTADGRTGYTANIRPGTLSRIELAGDVAPAILPVGPVTEAIALTPDGAQAWLGSNTTGKVYLVATGEWRVADSLQTNGHPYRIGFTPDGGRAVITNPFADETRVIDVRTRAVLAVIKVPPPAGRTGSAQPFGVAFAPDSRTAWITLRGSDTVAELDLASFAVRRYLPVGAGPDGIALTVR